MKHRNDIDGLRAIAVSTIVLYHFGFGIFGGGYVGVDVFFVISGFLIGRPVIDQVRAGTFSFGSFIERRARRLLPALIAMLITTTIMSYLLLLPFDLRSFGKSVIGATTYASNIVFYREAGYFDQTALSKPLLHTWSLAVEEQFYLIFPPLMILGQWLARHGLPLRVWILLTALASLVSAQWLLGVDPSAAFYLLPFRAWELLTGVMIGLASPGRFLAAARGWREGTGLLGILMIAAPALLYTHATMFPGLAALPVVIGSALVIVAGSQGGSIVGTALGTALPAFVGRISYSLYLWHWPIVVALNYYFAGSIPPLMIAAGLAATLLVSYLSWRYLEEPFRQRRWMPNWRPLVRTVAVSSCMLLVVGCTLYRTDGVPRRFSAAGQAIAVASGDFLQNGGTCFDAGNPVIPGLPYCRLGDGDAPPSFLVWGDSHGRAFRDGIDLAAREAHRSGLLVWDAGCPPLFGIHKTESAASPVADAQCSEHTRRLAAYLATDRSLRTVLLIGRWAYYTSGRGIGADAQNVIAVRPVSGAAASGAAAFTERMTATVALLQAQRRRVLILEQVPEIPGFSARAFAQNVLSRGEPAAGVMARIGIAEETAIDARQQVAENLFDTMQHDRHVELIRTHPLFCRDGRCFAWIDGRPALFDNNHITVHTSITVRRIFQPLFDQVRTARRSGGAEPAADTAAGDPARARTRLSSPAPNASSTT